jgi:hypothetical protein
MPDNGLTREDLERIKEFAKKNRGKIFQKKTDQKPVYLKKNKDKLFGIEKTKEKQPDYPDVESSDFPMSKEGSPTVTDTETGETTFGRPRKFEHGGMASCRGMGKAVKGGKFTGVK